MAFFKHIITFSIHKTKKQPLFSSCFFIALVLHVAAIIFAQIRPKMQHHPMRQKLQVATHVVSPANFYVGSHKELSSNANASSAQKNTMTLAAKKTSTKKALAVKSTEKKTYNSSPQQLSNEQAKRLLKDLQQSLAQIENHKEIIAEKNMLVPQSIKELKADDYVITTDFQESPSVDYHAILVNFLKDTLQLPAFGTVKVCLTLNHKGQLQHLEILASDSEVNRFYLEKELKQLNYPVFTKDLQHTSSHSFNLTFCSDQ